MKAYISHAVGDRTLAQKLVVAFRKHGVDAFDLYTDVYPGENWAERLSLALQESSAMVVPITPRSLQSPTLSYDLGYAPGEARFKGRLSSVISPEAAGSDRIPWILNRLPLFRLRSGDPDEATLSEITMEISNAV